MLGWVIVIEIKSCTIFKYLPGVDFFLETGSQISEAIENKTFSTIVSTLLGAQDGRLPENVQNLKVRAVLDYANGKIFRWLNRPSPHIQVLFIFHNACKELYIYLLKMSDW